MSQTQEAVLDPSMDAIPDQVSATSTQSSRKRITIESKSLLSFQRVVVFWVSLISLLGWVAAIALIPIIGVNLIALALMVMFYFMTMIGITVGYHRLLAHRAFEAHPAIQVLLVIFGSMAAQGPVIYWVGNHRRHHQFSDQAGDPHSPHLHHDQAWGGLRGFWFAHVGWLFTGDITNSAFFAKDLLRDPLLSKVNKLYWVWVALGIMLPTVLGWILIGSWIGALQAFLWAGLTRIFVITHAVYSINSITHLWGQRPFVTHDQSTNNAWLAILTAGESWHNNHHAFPNSAYFGLSWWQVDLGAWLIRVLKPLGWVWDIKAPTPGMMATRKAVGNEVH